MLIRYDIDISQSILLIPIQIPIVEWRSFSYKHKENNEILFITIIIMMNNDTDDYFYDI